MAFKLLKEFKEFAVKGNMIDIAIGVIIGASFNKVVDVIVKDVISPPLALLTGEMSLSGKRIVLRPEVIEDGVVQIQEVAIGYGKLLEATIDFLIIGITVFIVVKFMNSLRKKADDPKNTAEVTPKNIELLDKISDLMEKQVGLMEDMSKKES